MTRTDLRAAAAMVLLAACTRAAPPPPRPSAVVPAATFQGDAATISVRGEAFFLGSVQTVDRDESRVDGTFHVWVGDAELTDVTWVDESTLRARVPAGLPPGLHDVAVAGPFGRGVLPRGLEVLAGTAASLRATLQLPASVSVGQEITAVLDVENAGGGLVEGATPVLAMSAPDRAELLSAPPAPQDLGTGERWSFRWTYRAVAAGQIGFTATVTGADPRTHGGVSAPEAVGTVLVERPAALAAVARVDRQAATVGQAIGATVEVTNGGRVAALGVTVVPVTPEFLAPVGAAPAARDLAPGETATFAYTFAAVAAGNGALAFDATGTDANGGGGVAVRAVTQALTVHVPAAVTAVASAAPGQVSSGQTVEVRLDVANTGGAAAAVVPGIALAGTAVLAPAASPAAATLEPGAGATFTWRFRAVSPGEASFAARVAGVDLVSGEPVAAGAAAGPVTVQAPAFLTATVAAAPAAVSAGQGVDVELVATNTGGAAADVAPSLALSGSAALSISTAPPAGAVRVEGGGTARFRWRLVALGAGDATVFAAVTGTDVNAGAPVGASGAAPVHVDVPARLEAELLAAPDPVNEDQELRVHLRVRNVGGAAALDVAPGPLALAGTGAARLVSGPSPLAIPGTSPASSVAGGAETWFEWRYTAAVRGTLELSGSAAGVEAHSGDPVTAAAAAPILHVQRPASLVAGPFAAPARVNAGQAFRVDAGVSNVGEASARDVRVDLSAAPDTAVTPGDAPAPLVLAGGAPAMASRWFTARALGAVAISAKVTGTDATDLRALTASAPGISVVVERPAALSAELALPAAISPGELTVTLTVTNTGDATAEGVFPGPLVIEPTTTATVALVSGPTEPATLAGGAATVFTWQYRADAVGALQLSGSVSGTDANDGGVRTATANSAVAPAAKDWARVIASDPFGDGTSFAFVAGLLGQVWVGPSGTGTGLVRMHPDGSAAQSVGLSFPRDTAGNVHSNTATPYASIGYTGCTTNSLVNACGPDNEDGRGLLTSVTVGGVEWLVLGGARSGGDLDYVYLSRVDASPLAFWFVDLSAQLGGNTRGFSAAFAHGDRLYLGFPDNGGNRPYGIALLTMPTASGLNAASGTNAIDMNLAEAFKKALGAYQSIAMVDAVGELNGRLYFLNDIGCIVSTTSTPATKDDFTGCSPPASAAYDQKGSVHPNRQYDLEPKDRAWPQVAAWNGLLYAIRNTTTGPQLWACDPGLGANPAVCEPTDWSLVAADGAYRTRLGKSGATAATLLVATPNHLWIGFDDPGSGIHVFRTAVARPALTSDFTGRDGCVAGTAGCDGIGGDGVGDPSVLTRIFDAKAIAAPDGTTDLYLTAGDGAAPVRVLRVAD